MTDPVREWRRGWPGLAASTLALGCGANLHYYVSTFFVRGISDEFGVSRGELASLQALALWGVLAAPAVGALVDRMGANKVLTAGSVALVIIYLAAANMPVGLWAPLAVFVAIQAIGQATATVPHTRVVGSWFTKNRGLALGLAITGIPLVSALVSPLLSALVAAEGWRAGYYLLAALALLVALPLNRLFVRERAGVSGDALVFEGVALARAARTRAFWLLAAAMVLVNIPAGGFLNQLVPLLTDDGLSAGTAALMVSTFAIAVIVGRLACGFLLDRVAPAVVAALFSVAPAAGMILLAAGPADLVTVATAVALVGLQQGAELDLLAFFTARLFGLRHYASIYASGYAVSVIATSFGLIAFGLSHDRTGSYDAAMLASAVTFTLGACCFALLHPDTPRRPTSSV